MRFEAEIKLNYDGKSSFRADNTLNLDYTVSSDETLEQETPSNL